MSTFPVSRRDFLAAGVGSTVAAVLLSPLDTRAGGQSGELGAGSSSIPSFEGFPRQSPKLVEETVGASHGRFDRVRELVAASPELAKSSWDWGFGDWEAPIDAASHTGQREIAAFLMENGARPTLFTFAMFGALNVVKAILDLQPELRKMGGPHGLSLLHHARVGGERAVEVERYLVGLGGADGTSVMPSRGLAEALVGRYAVAGANGPRFEVVLNKQHLAVVGEGGIPRNLFQLPDASFHPVGAPSVRFRFEIVDSRAKSASVRMGTDTIQAILLQ